MRDRLLESVLGHGLLKTGWLWQTAHQLRLSSGSELVLGDTGRIWLSAHDVRRHGSGDGAHTMHHALLRGLT